MAEALLKISLGKSNKKVDQVLSKVSSEEATKLILKQILENSESAVNLLQIVWKVSFHFFLKFKKQIKNVIHSSVNQNISKHFRNISITMPMEIILGWMEILSYIVIDLCVSSVGTWVIYTDF